MSIEFHSNHEHNIKILNQIFHSLKKTSNPSNQVERNENKKNQLNFSNLSSFFIEELKNMTDKYNDLLLKYNNLKASLVSNKNQSDLTGKIEDDLKKDLIFDFLFSKPGLKFINSNKEMNILKDLIKNYDYTDYIVTKLSKLENENMNYVYLIEYIRKEYIKVYDFIQNEINHLCQKDDLSIITNNTNSNHNSNNIENTIEINNIKDKSCSSNKISEKNDLKTSKYSQIINKLKNFQHEIDAFHEKITYFPFGSTIKNENFHENHQKIYDLLLKIDDEYENLSIKLKFDDKTKGNHHKISQKDENQMLKKMNFRLMSVIDRVFNDYKDVIHDKILYEDVKILVEKYSNTSKRMMRKDENLRFGFGLENSEFYDILISQAKTFEKYVYENKG